VNELAGGPIGWEFGGTTATVLGAAVLVGILAAVFAARALRRRTRSRAFAAYGASGARGLAVVAALLAAAAPHLVSSSSDDSVRLVAAAEDASVRDLDADAVVTWPDDAPSAAAALETLRAGIPPGEPADLLLQTGPESPAGRSVERALRATRRTRTGILADGVENVTPPAATTEAPRIIVPAGAVVGIPVTLVVDDSGRPFEGQQATLTVGDRDIPLALASGERRVESPPLDLEEGTHLVVLRVPGRTPAVTFVEVAAAPSITIVTADAEAGSALTEILRAQGLAATAITPDRAGRDGFGESDVIVLGPGARGGALDARVSGRVQSGTGLLVLGGKGEDGLRRHAGGMVEPLLPITLPPEPPPPPPDPDPPKPPDPEPPDPPPDSDDNPEVKLDDGPKEALRVALLLVIDRSGSMAGTKLQLAQMAAMAAARNLDPQDRVAVLAFDDRFQWIAPFQAAADTSTLKRRLGGLRADGGTDFYGALKAGFEKISQERCGIRHVILLSDGATRAAVFRPLVDKAASHRVTLSTIAIGDGADTRLLGLLAGWGKGHLYLANDPRRLPEVVTIDARKFTIDERDKRAAELEDEEPPEGLPPPPDPDPGGDDATASDPDAEPDPDPEPEKETAPPPRVPRVVADAAFLSGLEKAEWPAFAHPEDPEPRGIAHVVLAWDEGEKETPALTLGRSGTARVAVLAADICSTEGRAIFEWDRGGAFLAQLVRSLAAPPALDRGGVVAAVSPALDGTARVAVPIDGDGILRLTFKADGEPVAMPCASMKRGWTGGRTERTPIAGVWTGLFIPATAGALPRHVALVSPGPARPVQHAATDLANASGAQLLSAPPDRRGGPSDERKEPIGAPLAAAAAAFVLVEALLRRLV